MAAPEKFFDYDFLDDGVGQDIQWVAPQIGSALTPLNLNSQDQGVNCGWVFDWDGSDLGGLYGARKPLPAARDISARRFLWVGGFTSGFATNVKFADLADGGVRFYLTDSGGAYNGYILYGRDVTGNDANPPFAFGSFLAFNNSFSQMWWCIDLDRTPDYSSGTLDLTDIVAVEAHVKNNAVITNTNNGRAAFGYLLASGNNIIRAGEVADPADFTLLPQSLAVWSAGNPLFPGGARQGQALTPIYDGANGQNYATITPVYIGDGSTATYFRQGRGTLSAQLSMEAIKYRIAQGDTPSLLPSYMPDDNGDRTHTINQSSADDVQFDSFTWSGYDFPDKAYAVEVTGSTSGTCEFLNNTFARAQFVKLRHGTATDCIFDSCTNVEINADTSMTGSTIRNAPSGSTALTISGAAGDYSGIEVRLNNASATYDIALGSGGAGTYDLSGVTVPSGYTLKLHNNSATNAVTVTIASGITTSTATAGGTITVQQPPVTYTLELPNIIDGSRVQVYNVTDDSEIENVVVSGGSGYSKQMTSGTDYTAGDTGRYRIAYQSGTSAKDFIEGTFTFTAATATNSIPASQVDQASYNSFGVDGSGITGISWDSGNLQIDLNDTDNQLNIQTIAAWYYYFITTSTGIDEAFGGIDWETLNSVRILSSTVDITLDNVKAAPLLLNGGRMYRDDDATIIATSSNSIQIDYSPVYTNVISTASPVITGDIDDVPAAVQTGMTSQGFTTARAAKIDNLDTTVSSRNATAPDNASITAIKAKTDNLPVDPASTTELTVINDGVKKASLSIPHGGNI